jgi:catechol 2,3-dioxygenase-like lactoylglutathione lyase family enzyme
MQRPGPTSGMRHIAIFVKDLEASEQFFVDLMGMQVEWRPDPDNVYLTSGNDNLALHRALIERQVDRFDHIGFFI